MADENYVVTNNIPVPDIQEKPILRLKHISHIDLDGYGATILSMYLQTLYPDGAMKLDTANILPNRLYDTMVEVFEEIDNYDLVVVTDLSISQNIVDLVVSHPKGNKIRVFDHHKCSITNLPENFIISSYNPVGDKLTCATELYHDFICNDRVYSLIKTNETRIAMQRFVEYVRVYDTFEFWGKVDTDDDLKPYYTAPRLNSLFHVLSREEFIEYILNYFDGVVPISNIIGSSLMYPWTEKVLEIENNKNQKYVESAIKRNIPMEIVLNYWKDSKIYSFKYNMGIIFAERSSPVIAKTLLDSRDDIQICAIVSNNQISLYTNSDDIDVSVIAASFAGGGHKKAAGFTIPYNQAAIFATEHFIKMIECASSVRAGTVEYTVN